jgi:CTP-dependent riboflavin kinase
LPKIVFKGVVFSGKGEGCKFIDLPWVKAQIIEKLGFTPFSGTLNICLTKETVANKKLLVKPEHFEICPEKGYCNGILIKASINRLNCAIIVPEVPNYPSAVLEVIAPFCLRERFSLSDGDEVTVTVDV